MLLRDIPCELLRFLGLLESTMLWIGLSENHFRNFWFDGVEYQSIINVSRYESKNYTLVFLDNFEVTLLEEKEDASFFPSLSHVLG